MTALQAIVLSVVCGGMVGAAVVALWDAFSPRRQRPLDDRPTDAARSAPWSG